MAEYSIITNNNSISETMLNNLEKTICRWQRERSADKLDVHVCVTLNAADSDDDWGLHWESQVYKQISVIRKGAAERTLNLYIEDCLKCEEWEKKYKGKLRLDIYVGWTRQKIMSQIEQSSQNDKKSDRTFSAEAVMPRYRYEQLVLDRQTAEEIDRVIGLLSNIDLIYNKWGFNETDPTPRSIVNLWGPPGTGKTMAVHAIAARMGKKILVVNYADIESKFVGEAPKNLIAAFDKAEAEDAVIFFDEADSFLGRRITNVSSGSEQAINSLRSQMLMKLENYRGIVFFATNLHENYDRAFESRILKHIEFRLPDCEARSRIIESMLPKNAPYSEDVYNRETNMFDKKLIKQLADIAEGFSGRELKNAVLESLVNCAMSNDVIMTAELLLRTFSQKKEVADSLASLQRKEKRKLEKTIKQNLKKGQYNVIDLEKYDTNKEDNND